MELKVYINGKLYPKEDAKVSVFDHGLLYGDGKILKELDVTMATSLSLPNILIDFTIPPKQLP